MTSKFLRFLLALAVTFAISALAQTGSAATPSSPAATPAAPSATPATTGPSTGTKVGAINIQEAIFGSNEGRRDLETLQKKFEPKQTELKGQNDELEGLKKQLTTQQDKLNEEALATLKKQIESKQKVFDRSVQDAQEDFGNQHQEIATPHPAEDGSDDREVFPGQRLRHDRRHLEALAAESCSVVGRNDRHHQGGGGCVQRAVWRGRAPCVDGAASQPRPSRHGTAKPAAPKPTEPPK